MQPNESDHLPIILEVRKRKKRRRPKRRRFRLEEFWLREEDCRQVVESGWGSGTGRCPYSKLRNKIQNTRDLLLSWSKERFGSLRETIARTRERLGELYEEGQPSFSDEVRGELEKQLRELLQKEQAFWQQRSRVLWLAEGDLNTKYFHQKASNRRKKNTLRGLYNSDGVGLEDLDGVPRVITEEVNQSLMREVTAEEVWRALKQIHPSKAPGPDGLSPMFYQQFWDVVGVDVVEAVKSFLYSEEFLRDINCTWVTLIPKVKKPENMQQLRPISLCNVIYKIGSKLLANSLKPLLDSIISPFQSAFVPGRLISDNSLLAFEISHCLKKRRRGKVGYGALKLDMNKAYDRVEWRFLEVMLIKLGFCMEWTRMILRCVRTVSYSFIINGDPVGQVVPSRGLRQGDAISPYLFVIYAEFLSRQLVSAEGDDEIQGVRVCTGAPTISHLLFADDSFIFFKAEERGCRKVGSILSRYETLSRQQVSLAKSKIAFSQNVPRWKQDELAAVLGVKRVEKHKKYLGLPTELSYSKEKAFSFLCERIRKRTQGWRDKTLTIAGKEVLIKAVVQSIPTYIMSCFELPKHMCSAMQRLMARFWWGDKGDDRKIHWVAWEKLCTTKAEGGLGFRDMRLFNMALLAKQGWRLIRQPNSLLAQVLKARYFPSESFMEAEVAKGCSFTWRSILKGRDLLKKGLRFQVGNGESISVWDDPWIPLPYSFRPYSPPMEGTEELRVCDLIDPDTGDWNVWLLNELFMGNEVDIIARIALSNGGGEDRMVWHFDNKGVYSVKSGYHVARMTNQPGNFASTSDSNNGTRTLYKRIWGANAPPKVRMQAWRLVKGILPTRCALERRVSLPDVRCVFCGFNGEDDKHLTKEQAASFLMALWVIWDTRNDVLWNGGSYDLGHMQRKAGDLLMEYQKFHGRKTKKGKRKIMNFQESHKRGGIGVVVRNELGICMAVFAQPLNYAHSALQVEAEALLAGILIAIHQGWDMVEIESDCSMLVDALHRDEEDLSMVGRIVEDCKRYTRSFISFRCRHIYREANGVANRLAHLASWNSLDELWFDEAPVIIRDVLFEDGCNVDRGLGNKSPPMFDYHINNMVEEPV
ncbi:PREDICTED: uncharacterized protein LOC101297422 [Fragaria vesca subsp. vesca]